MIPVHACNPVQIHSTIYTNPSQTQIQYKLDDARKNTNLDTNTMKILGASESYAHELCNGETPKQEVDRGLAPWWPLALGRCTGRLAWPAPRRRRERREG